MQKIANVYSPSTYGSMRVLLHLSMEKLECPIDRKSRHALSKGLCQRRSQPYLLKLA